MSGSFLKTLFPLERFEDTAQRFPLSCLCAAAISILGFFSIHEWLKDEDALQRLLTVLICGYFWFGIVRLFEESRGLKPAWRYVGYFGPLAAVAAFVFVSPQYGLHLQFFIPALLLMTMIAPFTKDGDDISVWSFNYFTWFGVGMSIIAGLILGGGLSAAVASVHYLFGVEVGEKIYGDIWILACALVAPLYALSWVPTRFVFTAEECRAPVQVNFIINWLLTPLVWLYMLILYAYLIKIAVTHELPRGQLAYLISGFGGAGVVTYLFSWPLRQEGPLMLRAIHKYFFPVLVIPTLMMSYGVIERITSYGVTEQRYTLGLAVVWFAALSVLFILKKFPLKVIPGLLAALFLLASFGPWGGVSVSGQSQFHRLQDLLVKNEILKGGYVQKALNEVSFEDRQGISSIVDYLYSTKRQSWLQPWFEKPEGSWLSSSSYETVKSLGFEYVGAYQSFSNDDSFNFYAGSNAPGTINISGFDYALLTLYANSNPKSEWKHEVPADESASQIAMTLKMDQQFLTVSVAGKQELRLDLATYAQQNLETYRHTQPPKMIIDGENADIRVRANVQSMNGGITSGKPEISSVQFSLFVDVKSQ